MAVSTTVRAWAAFGRNDIRGSYRDPLLVMIVLAPVIWTTGVAVLTPQFTKMLATRYGFDLVPYYPLVLTAFLLLTGIIIAGGLGAFLVLDEVDAGTLTALRVTPVPLSTRMAVVPPLRRQELYGDMTQRRNPRPIKGFIHRVPSRCGC